MHRGLITLVQHTHSQTGRKVNGVGLPQKWSHIPVHYIGTLPACWHLFSGSELVTHTDIHNAVVWWYYVNCASIYAQYYNTVMSFCTCTTMYMFVGEANS